MTDRQKPFAGDLVQYADGASSCRFDGKHWWFTGMPLETNERSDAPKKMTIEDARAHCEKMLHTMRSCRERGAPVWIWDEDFQAMEVLLEATAPPINYRTK